MSDLCVVCHALPGPVCDADIKALDKLLADIPGRYAALHGALMPGRAGPGERVAISSHITAGLPARIGALSLIGPGTGEITVRLHPLVRHWSIKRRVSITVHVAGYARTVEQEIDEWFHEAVIGSDGRPVLVPADDDDQVGTVPPREWLDMQVRRVRAHFGHHVPPRTLRPRRDMRAFLPGAYRTLLRTERGPAVLAFLAAVRAVAGEHAHLAHFGMLGYEDPQERSTDPVLDDIERRSGTPVVPHAMRWDVDYLRTWLARACAEGALDVAEFAAQLRAMHAEISRVLGETPDQEWIGRCPAFLAEIDADGEQTGRKRPCGGGLWQDSTAFTAQVRCPRCGTTWDTRGHAGAGTAREIRRVWPVDRRRRYTAEEIERLRLPKCPACARRVRVQWREATGTRDKRRTWQPAGATCDAGCDEARRVV